MPLPITSNNEQANFWSAMLRSSFSAPGLYGVDDDNTLAESGVYATYAALSDAGNSTLRSLSCDAQNLGAAAANYEQADAASAAGF